PRVLISNSMLVPNWANWDTFRELEAEGLTMYGQMTAGSWIYIGTQGTLQGTYETLAECATQHFSGPPPRRGICAPGGGGPRAAGAPHERRRGPLRRGPPRANRAPRENALPRPRDDRSGGGAPVG